MLLLHTGLDVIFVHDSFDRKYTEILGRCKTFRRLFCLMPCKPVSKQGRKHMLLDSQIRAVESVKTCSDMCGVMT